MKMYELYLKCAIELKDSHQIGNPITVNNHNISGFIDYSVKIFFKFLMIIYDKENLAFFF